MKLNPFLFHGFEPSRELDEGTNQSLISVLVLSPNDSVPFGYIVKDRDRYRGHLEICSSQGVFSAYAAGARPEAVLGKLKARVLKQLKRWRKSRSNPPVPPLPMRENFA